jgi:hypothetical protein
MTLSSPNAARSFPGLGSSLAPSQQSTTGPWDIVENSAATWAKLAEACVAEGNKADAIEAVQFAYLAASRTPIGDVLIWHERTKQLGRLKTEYPHQLKEGRA